MAWTPFATKLLIAGVFVALLIFDVVVAAAVGNEATLSFCMKEIGRDWNVVWLLWGGLTAHFFWNYAPCWCGWRDELRPVVTLLIGFLAFRYAWPQALK